MASFKEDVLEHVSAIYQTVEDEIKSWTDLLKEVWPLLILLLVGLLLLIWFAKPAPPKKVLMATGTGGSYKVLGEKYQEYFKKKGIQIELIPTHGSSENLHHLIDRGCVKTQNTSIDLDLGRVHGFWPSIKHFWLGQQFCFGNL